MNRTARRTAAAGVTLAALMGGLVAVAPAASAATPVPVGLHQLDQGDAVPRRHAPRRRDQQPHPRLGRHLLRRHEGEVLRPRRRCGAHLDPHLRHGDRPLAGRLVPVRRQGRGLVRQRPHRGGHAAHLAPRPEGDVRQGLPHRRLRLHRLGRLLLDGLAGGHVPARRLQDPRRNGYLLVLEQRRHLLRAEHSPHALDPRRPAEPRAEVHDVGRRQRRLRRRLHLHVRRTHCVPSFTNGSDDTAGLVDRDRHPRPADRDRRLDRHLLDRHAVQHGGALLRQRQLVADRQERREPGAQPHGHAVQRQRPSGLGGAGHHERRPDPRLPHHLEPGRQLDRAGQCQHVLQHRSHQQRAGHLHDRGRELRGRLPRREGHRHSPRRPHQDRHRQRQRRQRRGQPQLDPGDRPGARRTTACTSAASSSSTPRPPPRRSRRRTAWRSA